MESSFDKANPLVTVLKEQQVPNYIIDPLVAYDVSVEEFLDISEADWKADHPSMPNFVHRRLLSIQKNIQQSSSELGAKSSPQPLAWSSGLLSASGKLGSGIDQLHASRLGYTPSKFYNRGLLAVDALRTNYHTLTDEFFKRPIGRSGQTLYEVEPHQPLELFRTACLSAPASTSGRSSSGSAALQFNRPWGVAANPSDEFIYVNDHWNHRVQIIKSDMTHHATFCQRGKGPGEVDHPRGIVLLPSFNKCAIVDNNNNRVQLFTLDGQPLKVIGAKGNQKLQFDEPFHIASDSMNNLYVSDRDNNRIQVMSHDGEFIREIKPGQGGSGGNPFSKPMGVAVLGNDTLCVLEEGGRNLRLFNNDGRWIQDVGINKVDRYNYIASGPTEGVVTVSDFKGNKVVFYNTKDGKVIHTFGSSGSGLHEFDNPTGVAWGPSGHLYVCDFDNHRVLKF